MECNSFSKKAQHLNKNNNNNKDNNNKHDEDARRKCKMENDGKKLQR